MVYGSEEFNDRLIEVIREEYRHPLHEEACTLAEEMSVHVYGEKPVELLRRPRPGEDAAIQRYREDNYEPTTKGPCGKAIDVVSKIFNPNLSSIIFPQNENAKQLQEYTMQYYPQFNSIIVYNKDVTLKMMLADANALQVVKPLKLPANDTQRVMPVVMIYSSHALYDWDHEHYLIFIDKVDSNGSVIWTFDYVGVDAVMRFTAVAPKDPHDNILLTVEEEYRHSFVDRYGIPEMPAWRLKGNAKPKPNGEIVYESYFVNAKAHWNLSLIHESDLMGSIVVHTHPQRYIITEECQHQENIDGVMYRCAGGYLKGPAEKGFLRQCSKCKGSGKLPNSPYEDYEIMRKKLDDGNVTIQPVGYVNVPVDATKLLAERCDALVQKGSAAINMDIEDKVGENQSGIAKVYDRSAQNNTVYTIGSTVFEHLNNQFYFINKYMFQTEARSMGRSSEASLPQVNKPTSFNIETVSEIIAGFKESKDAGADRSFLQLRQVQLVSRDLETNPELKKYYVAVIMLDPLFGMAQIDIDANLMQGTVRKVDASLHANLKPFVDRAMSEHPDFLEKRQQEQLEIVTAYAEELIEAEQPRIDLQNMPPDEETAAA